MKHSDGMPWNFAAACAERSKKFIDKPINDPVNHPMHYTRGKVQFMDAVESAVTGLVGKEAGLTWAIIKYMWRWKFKGQPLQDLEKAQFHLNRLIDHVKEEKPKKQYPYECLGCGIIFGEDIPFIEDSTCPVCGAGAKEVEDIVKEELHD